MSARSLAFPSGGNDRNWDSLQFRFIYALSFVFHLFAAIGARVSPIYWTSGTPHRSILAEALGKAGTTAQIAFAG